MSGSKLKPILQTGKLGSREVKWMMQGHPYTHQQGQAWDFSFLWYLVPFTTNTVCLNWGNWDNMNICYPEEYSKCYLTSRECPSIHYTVTLTFSNITQKKTGIQCQWKWNKNMCSCGLTLPVGKMHPKTLIFFLPSTWILILTIFWQG